MQSLKPGSHTFTSSVGRKGQITLPAPIRRLLGVSARDKVTFLVVDGEIHVTAKSGVTARTAGILASEHPMLSSRVEKTAAEEAMADEAAP
jgi:AbrB family looped-hinge helix DNA binding protein